MPSSGCRFGSLGAMSLIKAYRMMTLNRTVRAILSRRGVVGSIWLAAGLSLSGCSAVSGTGPSINAIKATADGSAGARAYLVNLDMKTAQMVHQAHDERHFSKMMETSQSFGNVVGAGDVLSVAIWEAPPAVLFGGGANLSRGMSDAVSALARTSGSESATGATIPDQVVGSDGAITIPFIGRMRVVNKTLHDVEAEIVRRLRGKAHLPQAMVNLARNATRTVTVVGEVEKSGIIPLTAKGERVLDALAAAGGSRQPINKITVQLNRDNLVESVPLEEIIRNPQENISLQPGDIITAYFQPLSFTSLGATGQNKEVPFESTGLSLAQALGRVGGLEGQTANPAGGFIFRLEDRSALGLSVSVGEDQATRSVGLVDDQGKVPVIYRFNLRNPETIFAAQKFPMRDKDVLYVSTAPVADIQKFAGIISSTIFPIISLEALFSNNN